MLREAKRINEPKRAQFSNADNDELKSNLSAIEEDINENVFDDTFGNRYLSDHHFRQYLNSLANSSDDIKTELARRERAKEKSDTHKFLTDEMGMGEEKANEIVEQEDNPLKEFRSNILLVSETNGPLYVEYKDGKIYGGGATNAGLHPKFEMEWDHDLDVYENLQNFYNKIIEEDPSYLDSDD